MASIGFIGLGAMGLPMARRLCAVGHSLKVAVHSNPAPAKEIEALGGTVAGDFAAVMRDVEYIITIVPEDTQLRALFLSPDTVGGIAPGTVLIEMTSSTPSGMQEIAAALSARGVSCLDAPVSGGVKGAANGTLTIICGGEKTVFDKARPILDAMGEKVMLVGALGAGKALKAINQMLVGVNTVVAAEALALARKLEIDLDIAFDVIRASSGASTAFTNRFKRMAGKDFAPAFKLALMRKDIRIALGEAAGIAMPVTSVAYQLFQMMDKADDDLDFGVISKLYEKR